MNWQQSSGNFDAAQTAGAAMADLEFGIAGKRLPLDHSYALWRELTRCLPLLKGISGAGVRPLHGAAVSGDVLLLTRRAKLVLRLPKSSLSEIMALSGKQLEIDGEKLQVGAAKIRPLQPFATLHAHCVVTGSAEESEFVRDVAGLLDEIGLPHNFICGKRHCLNAGAALLTGYSLMLHHLSLEQSLLLQQAGLGRGRELGCGLFIPHKSIAAVGA